MITITMCSVIYKQIKHAYRFLFFIPCFFPVFLSSAQESYQGDGVNLAARMEQSGMPGEINISQHTYEIIKEEFKCVYRGMIEAKNKGEINMYFVEKNN